MKIFIKELTGKSHELEVNFDDTIKSIKEKLVDSEEYHIKDMIFIFSGKQLEDDKKFIEYNIKNEDTLHLIFKLKTVKKISVKTTYGKILKIDVKPSDKIVNIKEKIQEEGLNPTQYHLFFDEILLKDDTFYSDYNIPSEKIIKIIPKNIIQIKNKDSKILDIEVTPSDTIENIKNKIKKTEDLDSTPFHLFFGEIILEDDKTLQDYNISSENIIEKVQKGIFQIKHINGSIIDIEAKSSDIIENIKEKIKNKEEIVQCRCELIFEGRQLDDCKTLEYYNINEKSQIYIKYYKILDIILNINDEKQIYLNIESKDTIKKLKNKIDNLEGIIPNNYKLSFKGIKIEEDNKIEDYEIKNKDIIYLTQIDTIQIFDSSLSGKKITIKVESIDSTIYSIKKKIQEQEGIASDKYKLVLQGIKLEDYKALDDYEINNKSKIILKYYQKFNILITDKENKFYINAESLDTIENIKIKIKNIYSIDPREYILKFDGIQLKDYKALDYYNLEQNKTNIFQMIYCPLIRISIYTWTGNYYYLDAKSSFTISDVKKSLEEKIGIKITWQSLIFQGKTLEDNSTLDEYGIGEQSTLELKFILTLRLRGGY